MRCRLIFIVNADWFFYSHRLNLAKKAIEDGYEVHLITNVFLENPENIEGLTIHNFPRFPFIYEYDMQLCKMKKPFF